MKRIVICYDGTWNAVTNPNEVTNVVRVGQAVRATDDNGNSQIVYYNAGVGSGGPLDRFLGGVFGAGLRSNVKRGLAFLTLNWEKGDEIYIFGFSRGAYSARALAGVITAIGGVPKQEYFDYLEEIWNFYRLRPSQRRDPKVKKQYEIDDRVDIFPGTEFLVKCLAVWDTVGSYGIPAGLGLGGLSRKLTSWTRGFHDNVLSSRIEVGLQALAIDEKRRAFPATAWVAEKTRNIAGQSVEQVWFAGAHSNVGGGYGESGLSDLALIWMIARVEFLTGLKFSESYISKNFWPCAACSLYRSNRGWWLSSLLPYRRALFSKPKLMDVWSGGKKEKRDMVPVNEKIHWSVIERLGRKAIVDEKINRNYAPENLPAEWGGKPWREADRPLVERDERVAQKTEREGQLIALCRKPQVNRRLKDCALFCKLDDRQAQGAGISMRVKALRNFISPEVRRSRRLRRLRRIWNMEDADGC